MDDAGGGGDDTKVVEGLLAPLQKFVTFTVALEFKFGIVVERQHTAKLVDLHRVVDDQVDRHQRVDLLGVPPHAGHGIAQRSQIDNTGNTGEVLQDHTSRFEGNLNLASSRRAPACDRFDRLWGDLEAVCLTQRSFEQNTDRKRQPTDRKAPPLQGSKTIQDSPAAACLKSISGTKIILRSHQQPLSFTAPMSAAASRQRHRFTTDPEDCKFFLIISQAWQGMPNWGDVCRQPLHSQEPCPAAQRCGVPGGRPSAASTGCNAAMAHSTMRSSGSRVVSFCSHKPGVMSMRMSGLRSCAALKRMIS